MSEHPLKTPKTNAMPLATLTFLFNEQDSHWYRRSPSQTWFESTLGHGGTLFTNINNCNKLSLL